ncbi:MAG: type IX secretion system outer membrane channel protein PorV [Bacteroidota bacterium]
MNSRLWLIPILAFLFCVSTKSFSQPSAFISGQDSLRNPLTVAVPFLSFAPDSRASGMGDVGVATSPDANSAHWNNGKLAFIENDIGFAFSYSPWLANLVDDMSLNYLSFYKKIDETQTFGGSFRYFDLGEIALFDGFGNGQGIDNPSELAVDGTYSRKLSENMGLGVTLRFIWSNLPSIATNSANAAAGTSVAVDIGWYYTKPVIVSGRDSELSFGAHISNIGQKITYSDEAAENFIPGNLRIGSAFKTELDAYNSFTFALDINKLLIPTNPILALDEDGNRIEDGNGGFVIAEGVDPGRPLLSGTFGSFTDAPRGFEEEIEELTYSIGVEYWYQDLFSARAGYFSEHENKSEIFSIPFVFMFREIACSC